MRGLRKASRLCSDLRPLVDPSASSCWKERCIYLTIWTKTLDQTATMFLVRRCAEGSATRHPLPDTFASNKVSFLTYNFHKKASS